MLRRVIFVLILFLSTQLAVGQEVCDKSQDLIKTVQKFHYNPPPIDSSFCHSIILKLFEKADPYGLIFQQEDFLHFKALHDTLERDLTYSHCEFYNAFKDTFAVRRRESKSYFEKILNTPKFTIEPEDTLFYDEGKCYAPKEEMERRWHQWIQFMVVDKINDLDSNYDYSVDSIFNVVKTREECRIASKDDEIKTMGIAPLYLSSIAESFDPHTNYFSSDIKKEFFTALSDENLSFGFDLERNDKGQLTIATVKPGSSAWKSNQLSEGDILLGCIGKDKELHDFNCVSMQEVKRIITHESMKSAQFIIEKVEGFVDTILLHKTKLQVDENILQSFIIEGENKIGYIYLPSFYSGEEASQGCASDIARSILRLKRENIDGLIIDVRNNGGGFMEEAIKLSGMFINDGTVGIFDTKFEKSNLLKDRNRGTLYNGPLAIMVNQFSASASEFFAVTMQDYNRAVIVGETTFGKSTAQNVLPIEAHKFKNPEDMDFTPSDFVKITISRFYRVNGYSYQKHGVQPDIVLPNLYSKIPLGERKFKNALEESYIERETYFEEPIGLPLKDLIDASNQRKKDIPYYDIIDQTSQDIAAYYQNDGIPIGMETYKAYQKHYASILEPYESYNDSITLKVKNLNYLSGFSDLYEEEKVLNAGIIENIEQDFYIKETIATINKLIQLKQ